MATGEWLGRTPPWRDVLAAVDAGIRALAEGRSSLITIEGSSGRSALLDEVERRVGGGDVRRAELLGGSRLQSGNLADRLEIAERPPQEPVTVVVRDAQWADATSIGRLSRLFGTTPVLLVMGHAELSADAAIVFDRLGTGASRHATVHRFQVAPLTAGDLGEIADPGLATDLADAAGGDAGELIRILDLWSERGILDLSGDRITTSGPLPAGRPLPLQALVADLPSNERRFVEATALAGDALPLDVAQRLLDEDADTVLGLGESLAERSFLRDTPAGFAPPDGEAAERMAASVGQARRSATFSKLADAFLAGSPSPAQRSEAAEFLYEAGRLDEALPLLADAGIDAVRSGAPAEGLPLLDKAIAAYGERDDDPALEGRLRLARAQVYRYLGWSQLASDDADVATRRLEGSELVDAYGWAAALADDRQQILEAERLLAAGEYVAATSNEPGKLGSLLTLRARILGRLGFGDEAEAAVIRGEGVLAEHGTADQRTRALYNRAWIDFDQGRMRSSEARFSDLAARFRDDRADSALADAQGWRSRTLMLTGRPADGIEAAAEAVEIADRGGEIGPVFLAAMAKADGAALYGAGEEALHEADELLAIVLQQLPQWENAARFYRTQALVTLGRLDEAAEEIDAAILACPEGVDGETWRLRCRALALRVSAARGELWPADVADEVTEALLTGRWHLPAAQLLATRAVQEKDPEFARQGAALALQLGIPMVAAANAEAGGLWEEATGTAVAAELRRMAGRIPPDWEERWEALAPVAAGLAAPEVEAEAAAEAAAELQTSLQAAFQEAGLAGADHILSPAQRRAAGIRIRRRRVRRPLWQTLVGVGALVVIAAVAAVALVVALQEPEEQTASTVFVEVPGDTVVVTETAPTTTTTTTLPRLEERILEEPEREITAQWGFRGEVPVGEADRGLTGVAQVSAVREAGGYYWRKGTNDPIVATAVIRGRNMFFGNLNGTFFVYETDGDLINTNSPETGRRILTSATAELTGGTAGVEAGRIDAVFFGDTDGRLHGADAGSGVPLPGWDATTGGPISTAPLIVGQLVVVGSADGYVHAFSITDNGDLVWRFPADGSDIAPSRPIEGMALGNGIIYVAREDGSLFGLDPATGLPASDGGPPQCAVPEGGLQGTPAGNPVYAEGYVYVAAGPFVWRFEADDCRIPATVAFIQGSEASAAPAVDVEAGALFQPIGRFVLRYDISGNLPVTNHSCQYPMEGGRVDIKSPPSIARHEDGTSTVYFGDNAFILHAIDGDTCEELWAWETGGAIVSSAALGDGVVFVTSQDGTITAIGPVPDGE